MDRRYSPIIDLYGAAPEDHFRGRKSHSWLYVLLTIAGFIVIESIRPVMRLRPDPPPSMLEASHNGNSSENESRGQLTLKCWDYAAASLQNVYPYGSALPQSPPQWLDNATSTLCWQKLRTEWGEPDSWERSYEWSTDWLTNPDSPFQQAIRAALRHAGIT